jgi:uncharacterized membrane protein YeiB
MLGSPSWLKVRVGYEGVLGLTLTIFAVQMCASVWWLHYFRFGPMEWL